MRWATRHLRGYAMTITASAARYQLITEIATWKITDVAYYHHAHAHCGRVVSVSIPASLSLSNSSRTT